MKKVWVTSLGMLVGLSFSASVVLAAPAQLSPQAIKVTQEQQQLNAYGAHMEWQSDSAVMPLRGGNGGGTGPKDGTGNKNGARKGGGTGTCPY